MPACGLHNGKKAGKIVVNMHSLACRNCAKLTKYRLNRIKCKKDIAKRFNRVYT